jgi:hypothetical protein
LSEERGAAWPRPSRWDDKLLKTMASFVNDIFIAFIDRALIVLWRKAISRKWPVMTGTIRASTYERPIWGCDYALIRYQYKTSGERYEGVLKKPFLFRNYGEAYVRRFPGGSEVLIRVHPKDRSKSVFVRG